MNSEKNIIGVGMLTLLLAFGAARAEAAPSSPAPSWEGFYVGGDVGYGFGVNSFNFNAYEFTGTATPFNTNFLGSQGFIGGFLAGYNHVLTPRWLIGIEGDASWSAINHTDTANDGYGDVLTVQIGQRQAYSVRGRVGYLVTPETLLYGTGGWAWSQFVYSLTIPSYPDFESDSFWLGGAQIGAGIETMLAPGWSARLEYLQTFYNSASYNSTFFGPINVQPSVGVARLALIYRFGSDQATPWQAPPAKPAWNGVYVGGALGAGVANAKVDFPQAPGTSVDVGIPGALPTGMIGYNWHVATRWVLGAEGEVAPGLSTADFQVDWTEALRGRLGYLLTPATMLYGTAGWLTTGIRTTSLMSDTISVPSQRVNALEVGGGVETALTNHWAARFDYQYAVAGTLDDVEVDIEHYTGPVAARAQMQCARLGVVYMFDGR